MMTLPTYYIPAALFLAWILASVIRHYFERLKMPPGPTGLPLLGNVFQMPTVMPWLRFAEFSQKYGPVVSFNAAGHPVIVLNDHKSAYELLDRRGTNYSHRPSFIMAGELLCSGIMLSFIPYGDLFRRMRRVTHETFGAHAAEQSQPLQEREATRLVSEIIGDPENWEVILKRYALGFSTFWY
ncbi:hypothetical protein H2248_002253 [Termitomyces sp. 'cryptogamus']|nr:hypothetical protein H2248_002253 [Termitomyces sp. 'cryptogamus']